MLPTVRKGAERHPTSRQYLLYIAKRYSVLAIAGFAIAALLWRLAIVPRYVHATVEPQQPHGSGLPAPLPPLYPRYHHDLLNLPQHRWQHSKPQPYESFFYVAGHARGTGWGNAMEELLLNAYIAYKAKRSFVFNNYTWTDDMSRAYADYNGKMIPARIPYNVLIRGPVVGDPFPPGDHTPLAVSKAYYDKMCPNPVVYIREDVHDHISNGYSAKDITDGWVAKLESNDNPCIQTAINSGQLFNYMVFGDRNSMKDIWHEYSTSPIITHFRWSPLIELAFDTNRELFFSGTTVEQYLSQQPFNTSNAERYSMVPGLLAIHVRRGDFEDHCTHLANWSSDYVSFCSFQELPDQFSPPPHEEWGTNTPANHAIYKARCYPSIEQIVRKVHAVRQTEAGLGLRRAYIMTNGSPDFIRELKLALQAEGEWDQMSSSRDLVLNREQKYVAQAVDMLVGQRAQVLIGNGFSTMTSNIVMMRMANHFMAESTRFW